MNVLRKAMAREAAELKPLLGRAYHAIGRFQAERTPANEARLRDALAPAIVHLMVFRPLLPAYKRTYFDALESAWRGLPAGDLIMLFDHCIDITHLRLRRALSMAEAQQPWSRALLDLFDERRAAPPPAARPPSATEFLCSGIAASPGRAAGRARVVLGAADLAALQPGEVLVCRMATPDWTPSFRLVSAFVTDEGGALCHAAIVARELGLPCVTGCRDATAVIRTGDRVEVDGAFGIVSRV
jgi:phosphohistidine swiveling domain-containing protein